VGIQLAFGQAGRNAMGKRLDYHNFICGLHGAGLYTGGSYILCKRIRVKNAQIFLHRAHGVAAVALIRRSVIFMSIIQIIGLLAGGCTTVAFVPQVIKTWRSRSARDLSLGMFLIFTAGVVLWLLYGFLIRDIPVIAANVITLLLAGWLLVMKLRWP